MPQGIPQVLTRSGGGIHNLYRQAGISLSPCGVGVPVGLGDLFPHHDIEAAAGLVAEHEAGIVVIPLGVDEEGTTEIHGIKLIIAWKARPESD